jgi:undecaprenyl pyrophosphate phosphatase UppP
MADSITTDTTTDTTTDATDVAKTSWPFPAMAGALLLSFFSSAFVLPSPEGLETVRDLFYAAVVCLFLIRWRLAVVRHEQNRGWFLYFILILLAPLIVFLSEPVLKAL